MHHTQRAGMIVPRRCRWPPALQRGDPIMLTLSKPLDELTRVMLKQLYVTTVTIFLRRHAYAPGSEQVLGAVGIEWWYLGAVWKLLATGLQTPLACLGHATQERCSIPGCLAPGGHEALPPPWFVLDSLVAL